MRSSGRRRSRCDGPEIAAPALPGGASPRSTGACPGSRALQRSRPRGLPLHTRRGEIDHGLLSLAAVDWDTTLEESAPVTIVEDEVDARERFARDVRLPVLTPDPTARLSARRTLTITAAAGGGILRHGPAAPAASWRPPPARRALSARGSPSDFGPAAMERTPGRRHCDDDSVCDPSATDRARSPAPATTSTIWSARVARPSRPLPLTAPVLASGMPREQKRARRALSGRRAGVALTGRF